MRNHILTVTIAAAFVAMAWIPATTADTTLVELAVGSSHSSDFNDGEQGWTKSPVPPPGQRPAPNSDWAWGAPTSGPGFAASGSNVWATNLAGNYRASHCGAILSPPIDLTGAASASVAFAEWHHIETGSITAYDAGRLYATTDGGNTLTLVDPDGGYTSANMGTTTRACMDGAATGSKGISGPSGSTPPAPVYSSISADLSAFAGQTIQFAIAMGADGSIHRQGWYIDDFAVTIDGVTTVEDFEASDGGFTVVSTAVPGVQPLGWEQGEAAVGPAAETPLFGTNLDGDYSPNECAWLESEPFLVGPVDVAAPGGLVATLSWLQWFRSSSTYGGGVVQVGAADNYTIVTPVGGYPDTSVYSQLIPCLGEDSTTTGAFGGLIDSLGAPMVEQQADLTPWIGQTITVRFLFASGTSTATYEGWYVDDVNVDVRAVVSIPDPESLLPDGVGLGAPGWTSGGPVNTWAYGVATDGPAGHTTYKTNLAGSHDANECSYIQSPAIPGALLAGAPTVSFEHWHRIPGVGVNVPWAAGIVLASGDGGATWQHVAMPDYNKNVYEAPSYTEIYDNCLAAWGADIDGGGYGKASTSVDGNVDGWYTSTGDLSAYATSPSVQIRFAYASDGTFAYEGWAIRAVTIGGVKVL